jgi:hypothetical protein
MQDSERHDPRPFPGVTSHDECTQWTSIVSPGAMSLQ